MTAPNRRWFRWSLWTLFAMATVIGIWGGHWSFLAFNFTWGAMQAFAMSEGMRHATSEAWNAKPSRIKRVLVGGLLLLLLFWPAVFGLSRGGIVLGAAAVAAVGLGVSLGYSVHKRCFGWSPPRGPIGVPFKD